MKYKLFKILLVSSLIALLTSCGGGGSSDITPVDVSGTWSIIAQVDDTQCGGTGYTNSYSVTMSQNGSSLTIVSPVGTFVGTVSSDIISWTREFYISELGTWIKVTGASLKVTGDNLSGTENWESRDTQDGAVLCAGSTHIEGIRTSGGSTYTVGGTVTGLSSSGLVLQNNGGDDLAVAGVSFEFSTALADGAGYNVTILAQPTGQSCDVVSGNGTVNAANVSDVRVTCRGWGTAGLIETDNAGHGVAPRIAIDAAGNALAVWSQSDGIQDSIWSNRYTAGSGWGTAGLIESDNAGPAYSPQIAIDAAGNALAVWVQSDGLRKSIVANRYTAGSGWGAAELIETFSSDAGLPQIAIDAAGNALAVWEQFDGLRNSIFGNRYTVGSGWGAVVLIENFHLGDAYSPQIAIDTAGNALAVWSQFDGIRSHIFFNRYTASSGWGTAGVIESDDTGGASRQQIAIDAAGNALAVWQQSDGSRTNIWANRYTAGSGWGTAEMIESDNADEAYSPQIAIDAAGNALAVWSQSDGIRYNILANRYTAGSGWGTAGLIESDNAGSVYPPQIAIDPAGNALAVWGQSDGALYNILANRYTASSGWGTAGLIETDNAGSAYAPRVAIDAAGNALAVWHQDDGTRNNIWANRFE